MTDLLHVIDMDHGIDKALMERRELRSGRSARSKLGWATRKRGQPAFVLRTMPQEGHGPTGFNQAHEGEGA